MTEYELNLLEEFQQSLNANAGHLDALGQGLLRAIGRGSPELQSAVTRLLDQLCGFTPGEADSVH